MLLPWVRLPARVIRGSLELVRVCSELADDVGVELDADFEAVPAGAGRRDDYALAAGLDLGQRGTGRSRRGVSSINWTAVPPGIFDAAENTVEWRIEATGPEVKCVVQVGLSGTGSPAGIAVRLRSGGIVGTSVLDADGGATFPLVDSTTATHHGISCLGPGLAVNHRDDRCRSG